MCPGRTTMGLGRRQMYRPRQRACLCAQGEYLYGPREETRDKCMGPRQRAFLCVQEDHLYRLREETRVWGLGREHAYVPRNNNSMGLGRRQLHRPRQRAFLCAQKELLYGLRGYTTVQAQRVSICRGLGGNICTDLRKFCKQNFTAVNSKDFKSCYQTP